MQFNPTDKSVSIVGDIDFLLFSDSSTLNTDYSLIDRTRNINISLDETVAELYKADPNHKWDDTTNVNFPIATTDLTANKDHYVLLDSGLVVHRFRIKDENDNWVTLKPKLRSELTDTELNATGGTSDKYFKFGGAVFPLPVPDYGSTAGVELEFQRGGNHFTTTDTTDSPGFNSQFHQILSISAALRYALANGMSEKVKTLQEMKEDIRSKMVEHYQLRSPDDKPSFRLTRDTSNYGL
jgi:hypothetical protein